jgi:hypothetical protein
MAVPVPDTRSPKRKAADERLASEPPLALPDLPAGATPRPVESFLPARKPVAVLGVVENGLVRPLDPAVTLPERAKVIIVAANGV